MSKVIPLKIIMENRTEWRLDSVLHREDGPAVEYNDGTKEWYYHGIPHRGDGPETENSDGSRTWRQMGKLHRVDGPAMELRSGTKHWYLYGLKHRDGGPAEECCTGFRCWYQQGLRHRDDGPAVIYRKGDKYWYRFDRCLTPEEVKVYQRTRLKRFAMTLLPLQLPPYVIFWILQWSESAYIDDIQQSSVIKMLEGLRNSREAIKKGISLKKYKESMV